MQACKTFDEKRAYRTEWVKAAIAERETKHVTKKGWREIKINKGVYKTLAVLIEGNGYSVDPTGAVRRAARIAEKCVKLGGDWCSLGQHDEMEFLAINREYNEEFEKAWNMYETAKVRKDNMVNARAGV